MFEKMNGSKENISKLLIVLITAAIFFLTISVLSDDHDGRKLISTQKDTADSALCTILSEINGVGEVSVLVEYGDDQKVCGVIITAQGAGDPIVKNNLIKGVSTLYDIPVSNVMVFEKKQEEMHETKN